jgi:hypothetical protein
VAEPTWTFCIDLNGDGDYTDDGEDISAYVKRGRWQLGFAEPFEPIDRAATLELVLRNGDKRFSPEYETGALFPDFTRGKVIRIQSTYSGTTRTHFIGWIDSIEPTPNTKAERECVIRSNGFMILAQDSEVYVPVQEDKTADEVIELLLTNSGMLPPGFTGRWMIGSVGFSELEDNTILGDVSDFLSAETGKSTFSIIGDQWGAGKVRNWGNASGRGVTTPGGTSVYGALRDVAGREAGRVFVNRAGVLVFWNRHHLILDTTLDATFDNSMQAMSYSYGDDIINSVVVQAHSRTIGGNNETLGVVDQAVLIKAGSSTTITFHYVDQATGRELAGKNAVAPAQTTDFTANSAADGSGVAYTTSVSSAIVQESGSSCQVTFTNAAAVDVYLQSGAQIRGIKITDYGQVDVKREDATSVASYRRHRMTYGFAMDDVAVAEGAAAFFLDMRKDPRGLVKSITIQAYKDATALTQALARTIGDRVRIVEDQTAVDAHYFIIGEIFDLQPADLRVTWLLEPASSSAYWVLGTAGFSELGDTTIVGPY